ncbi:MAG: radical SAM protein [Magnetococcales bacterium]|nr:radical SAM protein [Magnetococcales bacterium]
MISPFPSTFQSAYLKLAQQELAERVAMAYAGLQACAQCGRACGVDRRSGPGKSTCRTGPVPVIASFGPHFGEESPLTGQRGSGTIFFARCNLYCVYCQNWTISWRGEGSVKTPEQLADIMLMLQKQGCHNINLVSPSHVIAPILAAVQLAAARGLHLPLVYNTGGYDSLVGLSLLDGVVDIYMPDMKYGDAEPAYRYSRVKDYPRINQAAVKEMHRQVGNLQLDEDGIARRGLLVRHLILPEGLAGSADIFEFLAREISPDTYLNIMPQYHPSYRAARFPPMEQREIRQWYAQALVLAREAGLHRLDRRPLWE